jgi:DNA-cytosine methyltransferase
MAKRKRPVYDQTWLEAEIVAQPVSAKQLTEPRVLVRRRKHLMVGTRDQELIYLEGPAAISLFTGAGGIDLGLEQAGFISVCQVEWDEACCETLLMNRPECFAHSALIQGDIHQVTTGMILNEARLRVGETHIVAGGPPCQGFSTSGKRSPTDARNDLVFQFLRVIDEAKPKFFMFENVPGFTNFNKGAYMKCFLERAYGAYYELVYGLVDAVEYGVPQYRCRFICMGTRRDLAQCDGMMCALPRPVCFSDDDRRTIKLIKKASLFNTGEADNFKRAPGIRYFPDRPVLCPPGPVGPTGGRSQAFHEFYAKLEKEEPDRLVKEVVDDDAA